MYKLVVDSSCEISDDMLQGINYDKVPFQITMDDTIYMDEPDLDIDAFFREMENSQGIIRTACPSPNDFLAKMDGEQIFIITITKELSGSYSSALIAKQMYLEKNPNARVHVFDSTSATAGETGIALIVADLIRAGKTFDEIIEITDDLIGRSVTIVGVSSLTNLARNGRIPKIAGKISRFLNIKLIARNLDGKIHPLTIARGVKKSLNVMVDKAMEFCDETLKTTIVISQANAADSAHYLKEQFVKFFPERKIKITEMRALSSTYAEEGGVVIFL